MKLIILGSTGSIGIQTLEVIKNLKNFKIEVVALACGQNIECLISQIKEFNPKAVYVEKESDVCRIKNQFKDIHIYLGREGIEELISSVDCDMVLNALSGFLGLKPTLCAIKNKRNVALANKESLVAAGEIVMQKAIENNVKILPVDSEHSAIFQCLQGCTQPKNLIITASGGPFLNKSENEIKNATVEQTLAHPKWKMGRKITVDSATLMNKGLEVIEAHHLFNISYENIKVVIHPQSLVHSAVEFIDGSVLAQIGLPSMHLPIQYALTYPKRIEGIKTESFSFFDKTFEFLKPDFNKFPALKLAYEAGRAGTSHCVVLNAANEVAVKAFLEGKIRIDGIVKTVEKALEQHKEIDNPSTEEIIELDKSVRSKYYL